MRLRRHRKIHRQVYHENRNHLILLENRENLHKAWLSDMSEVQVDIQVIMKKRLLGES